MANPEGSFIWYELMSPDPDASKVFYDAVVGWEVDSSSSVPGGAVDYRMIKRSDGGNAGGILKLDQAMQDHGARPLWVGYVYVEDIDAKAAAIQADGGKILMPPHDAPGIGRFAMVTDPVGVPIYIMKPTPPEGDEDKTSDVFSVDQPQHIRWNELATSDADGAIAFYTGHFGWSQEGEMDMGPMGKYRFLYASGVRIGAVMPKPPQLPVSLFTYFIGVDDIDRATKAVADGGGKILHGPIEIPGGEYSLSGMDPQGAAFGLVGPRKGDSQ
ncbi:MAG: VOC family protein [Sphingomicrobium sp.]